MMTREKEQKKLSKAAQFIKDCKDPFFFIENMWGLTPQPCYPEYEEVLKNTEPEDWKAEWFGKEQGDINPWIWHEFTLGKHITWQQCAILEGIRRAVTDYGTATNKIAVKTGNGIGKSCLGGWLVPWFLFAFHRSQVPCTAPTASQMSDVLWKEIGMWISKMPNVYKEVFHYTADYVRITEAPESWFARARTGRKENPEAFSGIHAPAVMAMADEASGVPDIIYEYGKGIATAPFWLFLMFSNPTRLTGHFNKAFDDETSEKYKSGERSDWRQYTFLSTQSPVVNWEFVEEKRADSGYDSDDYRIFVLGEFPKSGSMDDQGYVPLLTKADLEGAYIENVGMPITTLGVDPAGEGHDKSAFVGRNQFVAKILAEEKISTPKSVAAKTCTLIAQFNVSPQRTVVDNFGEGANVSKEIATSKARFNVRALNVGNKSSNDKFMNKRAELTWKMREWIKKGGQLVRDKRWNELLNLRYRYNEAGRLQIMSKEKMRKGGIPSPNFADAFMLTFAVIDSVRREEDRKPPKNHDPYE